MIKTLEEGMSYDVAVIGSGLAGLTAANYLAKLDYKVALFEQHHVLGGLAAYFSRKNHIFDVSLHGFPIGMIKSCRKYWSAEIAESIVQLKRIRFVNPQFDVETTFTREDFTRLLTEKFNIPSEMVAKFFDKLRQMNFYDGDRRCTREVFEEFFPGRDDVHRLLMEPIAYANGSTMDDEAITYGIVFSNFMSKGVYTFEGGTDLLIQKMTDELLKNGVDVFKRSKVEKILLEKNRVRGIRTGGIDVACRALLSNAHILNTIKILAGEEHFDPKFLEKVTRTRINNSSCQVYLGIRDGEVVEDIGDLIFTSENEHFNSSELKDFHTKSRTFSLYYPKTRPQQKPTHAIVASMNAHWQDWNNLDAESYKCEKNRIIEECIQCLEKFIPDVRQKIDHTEAATPKTLFRYTGHPCGTSFGTKFEGLEVSMELSDQIKGLYHASSVGIIMSGWLGAMNYGVITAHKLASNLA
ncbi:MAG: FAD-dependent oxidoreductase [Puniceicoccales bacterium]|jgi:phytoene dehydrogenase-like protein|nr:FAD-dependent oxidoreductase [Puniceicoccales bacterium]